MATTAVTPAVMVVNTAGDDLPDASGTVATTPADGWVIAAMAYPGEFLLLKFLADATGDTVVITAGDRPPSQRAGLGTLSIVLAANDVRHIVIEKSRFLQDDGTIEAVCTDAGTMCWAFALPKIR